jgi:hypothetical protein
MRQLSILFLLLMNFSTASAQSQFQLSFGVTSSRMNMVSQICDENDPTVIDTGTAFANSRRSRLNRGGNYTILKPSISVAYRRPLVDGLFLEAEVGVTWAATSIVIEADACQDRRTVLIPSTYQKYYDRLTTFAVPLQVSLRKDLFYNFNVSGGVGVSYIGNVQGSQAHDHYTNYSATTRFADANVQYTAQAAIGYSLNRYSVRAAYSQGLGWQRSAQEGEEQFINPISFISLSLGYTFGEL